MYLINGKNKHYLFERLENFGTAEDKAVWEHIDRGDYSIEHIMPQHLTPAWIEALGPDYAVIHDAWLHRIANLTLTAYNAKYSNNSFQEKRDMPSGFKDSGLRMNQVIARLDAWGLPQLEARNQQMQQRALTIWPSPVTSYVPPEIQLDSFTLADDVEFTGRTIARFSYQNTEQPVTSWVDMYERVLKILHSTDKSVLTALAHTCDPNNDLALHVSDAEETFSQSICIDTHIYVWTKTNTQYKINTLRRFFKLYGADPEELIFYMKDDIDDDDAPEGSLHDLRRRFWAYALPVIQAAHSDTGCYSNWTGTKENWIAGFCGISGCSIMCVANLDTTRCEAYLGTANKETNKRLYDMLFAHKTSIENQLGVPLHWDQVEDRKACKIYHEATGMSIANESDWPRIADFLSAWSKKMYDAVVPLLRKMVESQ